MVKAGIVGVSGYGGIELYRILRSHPDVKIEAISSRTYAGKKLQEVFPHISDNKITCEDLSPEEIFSRCDVVFTAVPHGGPAMQYAQVAQKTGKVLIDLSADFRLKDVAVYEKWYKTSHTCSDILMNAVYGLPELHREDIVHAKIIGNPGCYTTGAILAISPLLKNGCINPDSIIIDSKSGVSGAGRKLNLMYHFSELDNGFQPYGIASHRHTPEIEQELSLIAGQAIIINFTPHLLPMIRGIISTAYADLTTQISEEEVYELFSDFYKTHPFVRIRKDSIPNTKYVAGTNYIDIAVKKDPRTRRIIVVTAIDNLIKGASGQAVHNMNLVFGFPETTGLDFIALYP